MVYNTELQWGNRQPVSDKIRWALTVHDERDTSKSLKYTCCYRERSTKWREEWNEEALSEGQKPNFTPAAWE